MIQPNEMQLSVPMDLSNGVVSTTAKVWEILVASSDGNIDKVKELVNDCPELIYAQYNYTPPIHFAVREGHLDLVKYLLDNGAHDPDYKIYPFLDSLNVIARDRGYDEIASLLDQYANEPARAKYKGDNGRIRITRSDLQKEFQKAVDKNDIERVKTAYAKDISLAIMCAEANPCSCHRSKLISNTLVKDDVLIEHIDEKGMLKPHVEINFYEGPLFAGIAEL